MTAPRLCTCRLAAGPAKEALLDKAEAAERCAAYARQGRAAGAPGAGHAPRPGQGGWLLRSAKALPFRAPGVHTAECK